MWLPTTSAGEAIFGVAIPLPPDACALVDPLRCQAQRDAFEPHITLVGPFALAVDALPQLHLHLADVAAATAPFEVCLRGSATFLPVSPVAYLRVDDAASAHLCALEAALRAGPLAVPARFPFVPHVTLAMEHDPAQLRQFLSGAAEAEIFFAAREFGLYQIEERDAGEKGLPRGASSLPWRRAATAEGEAGPAEGEAGPAEGHPPGRAGLLPAIRLLRTFPLTG